MLGAYGRGRGLSSVVAEVLLVLVVVAAVAVLYAWLGGSVGSGRFKHVFGAFKIDAVAVNDTGFYVWLHGVSGRVVVSNAYLVYPSGAVAAVLYPVAPSYTVAAGSIVVAHYVPDTTVEPGTYLLRVPGVGDDSSKTIIVDRRVGGGTVFHVLLNTTGVVASRELDGYTVELEIETVDGYYRLWVRVCAENGTYIYKVVGVIYNSSLLPPRYVGQYYFYVDDYTSNPFTYPDCDIQYWTPLYPDEQPYHVAVLVDARPEGGG